MTHPIMFAAAIRLTTEERRRTAARENAFRSWGPRSVTAASSFARRVLGDEAVSLGWEALGVLPFVEHLQAVAPLDTVGGQHLELYYSHEDGAAERIVLRQSCLYCPSQQTDEVTSLGQLGQLLSQTRVWQIIDPRNGGALG